MKIGVMTIWWTSDNYGQFLQMYALQQALIKQGHEPFLIRYNKFGEPLSKKIIRLLNPVNLFGYIKNKIVNKKSISTVPGRKFNIFMQKYINTSDRVYNSYAQLKNNPPKADCYITGSDQVWHYKECNKTNRDRIRAFFLDFGGKKVKRASYAASFSLESLDESYRMFISPLLKRFDSVSVREESGIDMCKAAGREDAVLVSDPTFLLTSKEWCDRLDLNTTSQESYAMFYLLGYKMKNEIDDLISYVNTEGLSLKYVASAGREDEYEKIYPSIQQWLECIAGAKMVITNSFHGTVFCLIFNVPFVVLPLQGAEHGIMNCRLTSLLRRLGLEYRFTSDNIDEVMKREIDWVDVNRRMDIERAGSEEFLRNLLT